MRERHRRITGARRADRLAAAGPDGAQLLAARCHRRLRGPYTGVDTVLAAVLPQAVRRWPELVERHRFELLYGMPELEDAIGEAPATLASLSPFKKRTRFFGSTLVRCVSHGIVTFLLEYARRLARSGEVLPELFFDELDEAEATTQEFVALLVRRADPALLPVTVGTAGGALPPELEAVLAARAQAVHAPAEDPPAGPPREARDLVAAYVRGDCAGDDPAEEAAYREAWRTRPQDVRPLHDARAAELEGRPGPRLRAAALARHRERGTDPGGAGRQALLEALVFCVGIGFSEAVVDLGTRGRAVTDPVSGWRDYWEFTQQAAAACIPLRRVDDSFALYHDLLERYTEPKVHMMTNYAVAMLHTRFTTPRDHGAALRLQHAAVAIAGLLPDPEDRRTFTVFHHNGLALIEMHRGNLAHALELVESGMARLDAEVDPDDWQLHRSQLLYNRARLLAALGRADDALADYTALIALDPYYTDYLSERARVLRRRGDLAGALADYDRAVELAPPFPELYYNRGTARAEAGDVQGALEDFAYTLEMEPDDVDTRLARAELLLAEGDVDGAEQDVAEGLARRPQEPRLLCMAGTALLQRDEPGKAFDSLDAALRLDPSYPAALVNRAVAHFQLDRAAAAVEDLTAALGLVGDDPDLLLNRGIGYQALGRDDLALADFDLALTLPGADEEELLGHRARCRSAVAG